MQLSTVEISVTPILLEATYLYRAITSVCPILDLVSYQYRLCGLWLGVL